MSTVNLYRFYCNTESSLVSDWGTEIPLVCPNNSTHTINSNSIAIINSISENQVQVIPQTNLTGGQYRAESISFTIPANSTVSHNNSWPFNISVKTVSFNTIAEQQGDVINSLIAPNTVIGYNTTNVNIGNTIFNVNNTVINYSKIGYLLSIKNGTNTSVLGQVINISGNSVTCETPSTFNFNAGSQIMLTINNIRNFVIGPPGPVHLEASGSTSAIIPAGTIVDAQYTNNQNVSTIFNWNYEYFY